MDKQQAAQIILRHSQLTPQIKAAMDYRDYQTAEALCWEDIELFPWCKEACITLHPDTQLPPYPAFEVLIDLYTQQQRFGEAITLCNRAAQLAVPEGDAGSFIRRISSLKQQRRELTALRFAGRAAPASPAYNSSDGASYHSYDAPDGNAYAGTSYQGYAPDGNAYAGTSYQGYAPDGKAYAGTSYQGYTSDYPPFAPPAYGMQYAQPPMESPPLQNDYYGTQSPWNTYAPPSGAWEQTSAAPLEATSADAVPAAPDVDDSLKKDVPPTDSTGSAIPTQDTEKPAPLPPWATAEDEPATSRQNQRQGSQWIWQLSRKDSQDGSTANAQAASDFGDGQQSHADTADSAYSAANAASSGDMPSQPNGDIPPQPNGNIPPQSYEDSPFYTGETPMGGEYYPYNSGCSYFDGNVAGAVKCYLLGGLLCALTLGIYTPWYLCSLQRWRLSHRVVEGRRLYFAGTGRELLLPMLLWTLLTVVTLGVYGFWAAVKLERWMTERTYSTPDISNGYADLYTQGFDYDQTPYGGYAQPDYTGYDAPYSANGNQWQG